MKGGRGMLTLHSFISIVYANKANGTSPYPLHKGDLELVCISMSQSTAEASFSFRQCKGHKKIPNSTRVD